MLEAIATGAIVFFIFGAIAALVELAQGGK